MRTAAELIAVLDGLVGLTEQPDGSNNAPPITNWWGLQGPWCAMTVSYALAHSGWTKDGGKTLDMPGVTQQKVGKGWARVDLMATAFQASGKWSSTPKVGAIFVMGRGDGAHTGVVAQVNANGTIGTREGNYQNRLARVTRAVSSVRGYCLPAYDNAVPVPEPEEEEMLRLARRPAPDQSIWLVDGIHRRFIPAPGIVHYWERVGVKWLSENNGILQDDVFNNLVEVQS